MKQKASFGPSIGKMAVSVVITAAWIFLHMLLASRLGCKLCDPDSLIGCSNYSKYLLIEICSCECIALGTVVLQYLQNLVLPFLVVYLTISFVTWLLPSHNHY
ncbi:MAG: hypothetical protein ABIE22_04275 [archaeon]